MNIKLSFVIAGFSGDIHLDDDEYFTKDGYSGVSLPWVILHEIGHSLGLMHSGVQNSVMNPMYALIALGEEAQLNLDDISAIQSLYGTLLFAVFFIISNSLRKTDRN